MLRRLLVIATILLFAHGGITVAQERFELTVPTTTVRSTAELTASSLTINHQGKAFVYSRDTQYDVSGYLGFTSTSLRKIIRWPNKGTGSMQIAEIPLLGAPRFRPSLMQITRVAAPIGTAPVSPRSGPVDTKRSYRLTNDFLTKARSLAVDPRGATVMDRSDDFVEQAWKFVAAGTGTYRLTNVALGDGFSLTAHGRDSRPTMERTDLRSRAQLWRPTLEGTAIRLTNEDLGTGWSLDNVASGSNEPILLASGNYGGQLWTFTELATIVGTWQEHVVATNKPKGITVEIRVDPIRKEFTFRQTEPGKPDLVGTIQLVRGRLSLIPTGATVEQYLVTLKADRIDFRELSGKPTGFSWRRTASRSLSPKPAAPRLISQKVVPNPALEPVTIELANSHSEELWVLVRDLRDVTQAQRLKIPSKESASIKLDRDAGSTIVKVMEVPISGSRTKTVEVFSEAPPKQLYDISVYELFVQSIYIDRTKKVPVRAEDVNRAPKSVGLIKVPAGDRFKGGKTDIYAAAKRQKNPGAVGRIDPAEWRESVPKNDPLQGLLPPRR